MFQQLVKFEAIIAEKSYQFMCDPNAPIDHVKEALFQIQKSVANLEDQIKRAQEAAKKSEEESNSSQQVPVQENIEVTND